MSARDELDDLCQRLNTAFDAAGVEVADNYDDAIRALAAERDKARREYDIACRNWQETAAERDKAHQSAIDWRATWETTQDTLTIANTTQRNLRDVLRETQAERDALRKDVAFHADCRPNRQQAEAAMADAKATNDRWADAIRERDEARRVLKHVLSELKQTDDWGVVSELQAEIAAVLAQEEQ